MAVERVDPDRIEVLGGKPGDKERYSVLGPVAEVRSGRLRWHLPNPNADPVAKFLDNETHMLYDQAALDAAVAAERERILQALPGGYSVDPQWVADLVRGQA